MNKIGVGSPISFGQERPLVLINTSPQASVLFSDGESLSFESFIYAFSEASAEFGRDSANTQVFPQFLHINETHTNNAWKESVFSNVNGPTNIIQHYIKTKEFAGDYAFYEQEGIKTCDASSDNDLILPWERDSTELLRCLLKKSSDVNYFFHPIACLSIVSTSDTQLDSLLYNMLNFESGFSGSVPYETIQIWKKEGWIDANMLHYILIINDQTSNTHSQVNVDSIYASILQTFGNRCYLLEFNYSNTDPLIVEQDSGFFWKFTRERFLRETALKYNDESRNMTFTDVSVKYEAFKRIVSSTNIGSQIRSFLQFFAAKVLRPYLVQTVHHTMETFTALKKSLSHRFSTFRQYFSSASTEVHGIGIQYQDSSLVMKLRRLADYLIFLNDIDTAIDVLLVLRKELQGEKAWRYLFSVEETLGICYAKRLNNESYFKSMQNAFDSSIVQTYDRCHNPWNALSVSFLYFGIMVDLRLFKEAAYILIRALNFSVGSVLMLNASFFSALLFEHAARSLRKASSPNMSRKAMFYLMMAGHRYTACELTNMASVCFAGLDKVYLGKGWQKIEEYVCLISAREFYHQQDYLNSLKFVGQLLNSETNSEETQGTAIKLLAMISHKMHEVSNASMEFQIQNILKTILLPCLDFTKIKLNSHFYDLLVELRDPAYYDMLNNIAQCSGSTSLSLCMSPNSGETKMYIAPEEKLIVEVPIYNPLAIELEFYESYVELVSLGANMVCVKSACLGPVHLFSKGKAILHFEVVIPEKFLGYEFQISKFCTKLQNTVTLQQNISNSRQLTVHVVREELPGLNIYCTDATSMFMRSEEISSALNIASSASSLVSSKLYLVTNALSQLFLPTTDCRMSSKWSVYEITADKEALSIPQKFHVDNNQGAAITWVCVALPRNIQTTTVVRPSIALLKRKIESFDSLLLSTERVSAQQVNSGQLRRVNLKNNSKIDTFRITVIEAPFVSEAKVILESTWIQLCPQATFQVVIGRHQQLINEDLVLTKMFEQYFLSEMQHKFPYLIIWKCDETNRQGYLPIE